MNEKIKSQNAEILEFLRAGNTISPLSALELFGCLRLSGRVFDLRKAGHDVKTTIIEANGKRFASYSIAPPR